MESSYRDKAFIERTAEDIKIMCEREYIETQLKEAEQELEELRAIPHDMSVEIQCLEEHLIRNRHILRLIIEAEEDMYIEIDELRGIY